MRWVRAVVAGGLAVTAAALVPPGADATVTAGAPPSVWTETAYNSVFKDSGRSPEATDEIRLDTAKNDYEGAQIVLRGPAEFTVNSVDFTALTGSSDAIPASEISYNPVGYEYLNHNSTFGDPAQPVFPTVRTGAGDYPDRLLNQVSIAVPANQTQALWIRVHVPATAAGGVYSGRATVRTTNGELSVPISVNARNVVVPPANQSEFTNVMWTNFLGLTSWDPGAGDTVKLFYGHDRYSPQWWQLIDNWADTMKKYRQNSLQLPLINLLTDGGSKVDASGNYAFNFSRFDEVVQRFVDKGVVNRLEGFTGAGAQTRERNPQFPKWLIEVTPQQTGSQIPDNLIWDSPQADKWYSQFYPALKAHLDAKGWTSMYWMHVGDEAGGTEGEKGWAGIAAKVRQYFPGVQIGDTSVNASGPFIAQRSDIVIPNLFTYTIDPATYDAERAKGKPLWFYNCNIPVGNHLNRFVDQPEWSQRQTMWLAYGRGATGYLHWAYGNWQYKMDQQDVKGDGYIVRPDVAHNTVEASTRYESLRDGMEDWEVLNKLGKTNPGLAKDFATSLVQRDDKYSPDVSYMQRVRALMLDAAAGLPVVAHDLTKVRTEGPKWVQSDLGRQAQVDGVHVRWGTTYASNYKVLISYNGTNWAEAANVTSDGGDDFVGINGKARYIRVEVTSTTPYELLELEVAGNLLLQQNIAGGKPYVATAPSARFPDSGREATDGVLADDWGDGRNFGYELTKGEYKAPTVAIDLGYPQVVGTARIHAYEEYPDYRPDMLTVATSVDGVNYTDRGLLSWVNGASRVWYDVGFAPVTARYVRVNFAKTGTDKGTGEFVDDIEVYSAGPGGPDVVPASTAYQWNDAGGAGHEVIFAPGTTGSMRRWDWSGAAGLKTADWGGGPIAGKTTG